MAPITSADHGYLALPLRVEKVLGSCLGTFSGLGPSVGVVNTRRVAEPRRRTVSFPDRDVRRGKASVCGRPGNGLIDAGARANWKPPTGLLSRTSATISGRAPRVFSRHHLSATGCGWIRRAPFICGFPNGFYFSPLAKPLRMGAKAGLIGGSWKERPVELFSICGRLQFRRLLRGQATIHLCVRGCIA